MADFTLREICLRGSRIDRGCVYPKLSAPIAAKLYVLRMVGFNSAFARHRQGAKNIDVLDVFTGSIACSAKLRYIRYSEADFEVFRPAGATRCTGCNDKVIGPQN